MPIFYYDTKDGVPEDVREDATEIKEGENAGKWQVNLVSRKKLEGFRDNNTGLANTVQELTATVSAFCGVVGIKPEEFKADDFRTKWAELNETARKVSDGKLTASDQIDKLVSERTEQMRTKYEGMLQEAAQKTAQANAKAAENEAAFKRTFIDRAVSSVINKPELGVEPTAMMDIIQKAYGVFKVKEDNSLLPESNGTTLWGEDGATPMSVEEWINTKLRKEAPHYFKKSNGGGATGGAGNENYGGMSKEDFNKLPAAQRLAFANQGKV